MHCAKILIDSVLWEECVGYGVFDEGIALGCIIFSHTFCISVLMWDYGGMHTGNLHGRGAFVSEQGCTWYEVM